MSQSVLSSWYKAKEGQREALLQVLRELAELSNKEEGCIIYEVYEERKNPGTFFLFEKWDSKESFSAHSKQQFLADGFRKMEPFLEEPFKLVTYKFPE